MKTLVDKKNKILRKRLQLVTEESLLAYGISLDFLRKELKQICDSKKAVGLAANQIGYDLSIFYINVNGPKWYINPEIDQYDFDQTMLFEEGCLSFPNEIVVTKRPTKIKISHSGGPDEIITGVEAIVFQHEFDHLNGITMHERKV